MTTVRAEAGEPAGAVPPAAKAEPTPRWLRAGGWTFALVLAVALARLVMLSPAEKVSFKLLAPSPAQVAVAIHQGDASTDRVQARVGADGTFTVDLPRALVTFIGLEIGAGETLRLEAPELVNGDGKVVGVPASPFFVHHNDLTLAPDGAVVAVTNIGKAPRFAELRLSYPLLAPGPARLALELTLAGLLVALAVLALAGRTPRLDAALASPWVLRGVITVAAIGVLLTAFDIGWTTLLGSHPDEHGHVLAAQFYASHWAPGPVSDPDVAFTAMRPWGRSYLFYLDVVYFFAGKAIALLGPPPYLAARTFQLALLVGLFALAVWKGPRHPALALALAATPQVWYAFAYFNGDAFPLFVSMLAAVAVAAMLASTDPTTFDGRWAERIGFLVGLLLVSKANFWVLAAFLLFLLALPALDMSPSDRRRRLWRVAHATLAALVVLAVVWGYEQSINDFSWGKQIDAFVETHAQPAFRHSTLHQADSYPGLYLREKRVAFRMLFTTFDWHRLTVYSYLGLFGRMSVPSPRLFYAVLGALTVLGLSLLVAVTWRGSGRAVRLGVLGFFGLGAVLIVQSLWNSWTFDFQPQGRYLFPALPGAIAALGSGARRLPARWVLGALLVFFAVGLWAFVWVGSGLVGR